MTPTAAAAADGALVIDKPSGPSSHDIVSAVRRALGGVKVGHTGTLDPLATGVLPLLDRARHEACPVPRERDARCTRRTCSSAGAPTPTTARASLPGRRHRQRSTAPPSRRVLERVPRHVSAAAAGVLSEEGGRAPGLRARARLARRDARTRDGHRPRLAARRAQRRDWPRSRSRAPRDSTCDRLRTISAWPSARRPIWPALRRTRSGEFDLSQAVPFGLALEAPDAALDRLVPSRALLGHLEGCRLSEEGVRWALHGRDIEPRLLLDPPPRAARRPRAPARSGRRAGGAGVVREASRRFAPGCGSEVESYVF